MPAFIERGEHEEDQQHAQRKHVERGVTSKDLLIGEFRPLERQAVGQIVFGNFSMAACAWPELNPGAAAAFTSAAR